MASKTVDRASSGGLTAWYVVIMLCLLYIVSFADRLVIGVLVGPMKQDLGATDAQMGMLMGFSFAGIYSVLCLVLARVADQGNRRNLILWGVVIWSLSTVASAFAPNFMVLALCRMGVGVGEAALSPAALSMIASLFQSDRRHTPISLFLAAGMLGATGGFVVAAAALDLVNAGALSQVSYLASLASWRVVLLIMGLPGLVLALIFGLTVREPERPPARPEESSLREVFAHLAGDRARYLAIFVGLGFMQLVAYSVGAWYPTSLVRAYGLSPSAAGYTFGTMGATLGVAGALASPALIGWLSRRGRTDALLLVGRICLLTSAPCLVASLLWPNAVGSLAWMAPGLFLLIGAGAVPALAAQILAPSRVRAQVTAIYFLGVNLLGLGGGPWVVGALSDQLEGPDALSVALAIVVCVCATAGAICCFGVGRRAGPAPAVTVAPASGPEADAFADADDRHLSARSDKEPSWLTASPRPLEP